MTQSFGSRINLHPHLHFLELSFFSESLIAEFFFREVFSMLLHEGLIDLELVEKIHSWRHTGFNVQSKVRAISKRETERVGKYMIRPLLSLKMLENYEGFVAAVKMKLL